MAVAMDEKISHGDATPQYILCFIVNVVSFAYGMMIGWLAPVQPQLQANYTMTNSTSPLGADAEIFSDEDVSWISGFFCLGGVIGTLSYGHIANMIGRKKALLLCNIPFIIAFTLILMASNCYTIYAARFVAGLGGGGLCVIAPMYIGETAEDSIRGVLGSYFNLFLTFGILVSYVIGSYASYVVLGIVCLSFPIIFLFLSVWIPETPIYLLINNRTEEALASLTKLRGDHKELIEKELANLTSSVKEAASNNEETMSFKAMLTDPQTRKGLIIGAVVMTVQQFSGISPILNYTVAIFNASGSTISPNIATIIVGSLQFFGGIVATMFMERAGRKLLLLISSIGMTLSLTPIAIYFHLKLSDSDPELLQSIGWLPVTAMAIYIVVFGIGFGPVPFVIVSEIFKNEARSTATSISVFMIWGEAFLLLKFFSSLSNYFGIDFCFGVFAICSALGAFFTFYYVPETKGKSLESILWELGGKDPHLTPNRKNSPVPLFDGEKKKKEETRFEFPSCEKINEKA